MRCIRSVFAATALVAAAATASSRAASAQVGMDAYIPALQAVLAWLAGLRMLERGDGGIALRRLYAHSPIKRLLYPIAQLRYRAPLRDRTCDHVDCDCVWCQYDRECKRGSGA